MKLLKNTLIASAIVLSMSNAASATTLNVTNGILMGASGVKVSGELYDVVFKDDIVTNGISAFTTSASATAASQALLSQVFNGTVYSTNPEKINGCSDKSSCFIYTAYSYANNFVNESHLTINAGAATDTVGGGGAYYKTSSIGAANLTLAIWTKQATATAVPEPEAYAMMLAGLGLVGFAARRQQKAA